MHVTTIRARVGRAHGAGISRPSPVGGLEIPIASLDSRHYPLPPIHLLVMSLKASTRRSRRNGQPRRAVSIFERSHSTTRISSPPPASAIMAPAGSHTKDLPQNSISPPADLSTPTRLTATTK